METLGPRCYPHVSNVAECHTGHCFHCKVHCSGAETLRRLLIHGRRKDFFQRRQWWIFPGVADIIFSRAGESKRFIGKRKISNSIGGQGTPVPLPTHMILEKKSKKHRKNMWAVSRSTLTCAHRANKTAARKQARGISTRTFVRWCPGARLLPDIVAESWSGFNWCEINRNASGYFRRAETLQTLAVYPPRARKATRACFSYCCADKSRRGEICASAPKFPNCGFLPTSFPSPKQGKSANAWSTVVKITKARNMKAQQVIQHSTQNNQAVATWVNNSWHAA